MRRVANEQDQLNSAKKKLTVADIYESIKNSNSSLKRKPKKQLEDSIDRVLVVMKEELDDTDSVEGDFEGLDDPAPKFRVGFKNFVPGLRLTDLGT